MDFRDKSRRMRLFRDAAEYLYNAFRSFPSHLMRQDVYVCCRQHCLRLYVRSRKIIAVFSKNELICSIVFII